MATSPHEKLLDNSSLNFTKHESSWQTASCEEGVKTSSRPLLVTWVYFNEDKNSHDSLQLRFVGERPLVVEGLPCTVRPASDIAV